MTLFDPSEWKLRVETLEAEVKAVYRERAHFVGFLTTLFPSSYDASDPATPGYGVATVETPAGQMSWHIADEDADVIPDQAKQGGVLVWDGHSTEEKYARLRDLTAQMDETHTPEPEPTPPGGAAAPAPEHAPAPQVPAPTEPAPATPDDEKSAA